jgi:hypothetical protein
MGERRVIGENPIHTQMKQAAHVIFLVDGIGVNAAPSMVGPAQEA